MKDEVKLVGHIGVDAGLCWIGDPCYIIPEDSNQRSQVKDWNKFCEDLNVDNLQPTMKSFNYQGGHEGLGVCVSTGFGDGSYPVHATIGNVKGWGTRIKSVTITFIEDDDQEEETYDQTTRKDTQREDAATS